MLIPPAIIFANNDITNNQSIYLAKQLLINETISKIEFDNRVIADPNYPQIVHNQNIRLLVLLPTLQDTSNRELADVVVFIKQGLVTIEKNKYGPHDFSFQQDRLNIWQLLRAANSNLVPTLPTPPPRTIYPCDCPPIGPGGIFSILLQASELSICPNPDNERNNQAFINRK